MITECTYATTEAQCACLCGRRSHEHTLTGTGLHLTVPSISVAKAWRLDVWLLHLSALCIVTRCIALRGLLSIHLALGLLRHFIFDVLVAPLMLARA